MRKLKKDWGGETPVCVLPRQPANSAKTHISILTYSRMLKQRQLRICL
jgi:hypothetical protein